MVEPRVVNLRDFRYPKGRGGFNLPSDVVRIDRRSRWGNPYAIGEGPPVGGLDHPLTRDDVIRLYREWLTDRLRREPAFLGPLRGKRMACWCAPLACHGDVIAEFIP